MRKGLVHCARKRKLGSNVIEYEGTSKSKYKKHKTFEYFGDDELGNYFTSNLSEVLKHDKKPAVKKSRAVVEEDSYEDHSGDEDDEAYEVEENNYDEVENSDEGPIIHF